MNNYQISSTKKAGSLPLPPGGAEHEPQAWFPHKLHCCASRKYAASCFRPVRQLFKFPTVQAAEPATTSTDSPTLIQVLMNKKPPVLVNRDAEIQRHLAQETGEQRLRVMYSKDAHGNYSPEVTFIVQSATQCGGMAALIMSAFGAMQAKDSFIRNNQATKFETKFIAKRRYYDALFLGSLRAGGKWGLTVAFFAGSYMAVVQSIAVYRNKSGIREHMTAGFLTGGIVRMNLGLKGFIAGGIIGSVLGLMGGSVMHGILVASNETQEQRHYWNIHRQIEEKREIEALVGPKTKTLEDYQTEGGAS